MTPASPEDQQLFEAFGALEPGTERRARIEDRILSDLSRDRKSLTGEWLDLFRVGPVLHTGYALAAVAGLAVITPVGSLLLAALLL
jgi:hypothetical protein